MLDSRLVHIIKSDFLCLSPQPLFSFMECVCPESGCKQMERKLQSSVDALRKARLAHQGIKKDLGNEKEQNGVTNTFLFGVGAELPGSAGVGITFYLEEKCVMLILSQNKQACD